MSYSKLRGRIRERFKSQAAFAKAIDKSVCSVNLKLNGKAEWSASDIRKTCEVLDIKAADIPAYFFYTKC